MPWKHVPSISGGRTRRRQGPGIVPQRDLLTTLRRRELDAVGARLSDEIEDALRAARSRRAGCRHLPPAPHPKLRPLLGFARGRRRSIGISATTSPASPRRAMGNDFTFGRKRGLEI
jgi:hypothetical protein